MSFEFSSKSLIPFITYNGLDHADSQFCIEFLSKEMNKNLNGHLDDKQLAVSRCVLKTCEESLRWCMVLHRFVYSVGSYNTILLSLQCFYLFLRKY